MAKRNVSQAVPICKPRPEVGEVANHLCDLEDLRVHLERSVAVLDFFNEKYLDDPRELYTINYLMAMALDKINQQMGDILCQARRTQERLLEGDR